MENSKQHAIKSIAASKELCHIASMPSMQEGHSPLAICGFHLGCAVQLSAASLFKTPNFDQKQCRHRVVLMLGALRYTGKSLPGAQSASNHFNLPPTRPSPPHPTTALRTAAQHLEMFRKT